MSSYINIFIRKCVQLALHIFYVFPIKQNRIFFQSYFGKSYSCNPKYITEYLNEHYPGYFDCVWSFKQPEEYAGIHYIRPVKFLSFAFFYYRFTSKYIITNMTDEVYLPKRGRQVLINTWHAGGAYKRVGMSYDKTQSIASDWQNAVVRNKTDYYLTSSELFTTFNIREAYQYKGEVLEFGMPRNDLFFDSRKVEQARAKVEAYLDVSDTFIILYAPTFRGDFSRNEQISFQLPVARLIEVAEQRFGKKVVLLNRSHYNAHHLIQTDDSLKNRILDVTAYPDMQELLAAADLLITDYSSSIWDFALLARPCLLYVPDMDEYNTDRGTYTPMESWPGYICKTEESLLHTLSGYDLADVQQKAEQHFAAFASFEEGRAAEKMANLLFSFQR